MTLFKRTMSAILLLSSVALLLFVLPSIAGVLVLFALAAAGLLEFYGILDKAGVPSFRNLGLGLGLAFLAVVYLSLNAAAFVGGAPREAWRDLPALLMTATVFTLFVRQFPQKNNPQPLPTVACTLLGLVYVPLLLAFILNLCFRWTPTAWNEPLSPTARALVIYLVVVVKFSDIGAYVVGSLIGRHKLFPRISPGKTWEGVLGGFLTGVLASVVLFWLWRTPDAIPAAAAFGRLTLSLADALWLGALLAAIGVFGDLIESLMKRSAGLKDSGCLFPGMGGMLDVMDSLLFAAPALYFYLRGFGTAG
jgi:phosphatidate cytidylyltransferase